MKIKNKVFDFTYKNQWQIFKILVTVQIRYILWKLNIFKKDPVFFEGCTIIGLKLLKWHTIFFLGKNILSAYRASDLQRKEHGIVIK